MIEHWISPALIQRLAGSLLHFLWQGAAIVAIVAAVLRLLSRRSAQTRYIVSVFALLIMLIAPVLTFLVYADVGAITLRVLGFAAETLVESAQHASAGAQTAAWSKWIVAAWLLGFAICVIRLLGAWRLSRRLKACAVSGIPPVIAELFNRVHGQLRLRRHVKLLLSDIIDVPAVVGWVRPLMLFPVTAVTGLTETQLLAVLAHEAAHVRRHDFLINVVQSVVESILFYHPGVWWLSARIRTERENCCDDIAIQVCGDRLLYAEALIELERHRRGVPVLAVAAAGSGLPSRVRRILGRETTSPNWQSALAALSFVVIWVIAGVWQSSTIDAHATPITPALASIAVPITPSPASVVSALQSVAAIVTAQPVETVAQVSTDPTKGSLQGVVTNKGTGEPLANVQITLETPADAQTPLATKPNGPQAIEDLFGALTPLGISRTNMPQAAPLPEERVMTNIANNAPVSGVAVLDPDLLAALRRFRATTSPYKTLSDASGHFAFPGLSPGSYNLRAEREGYFGTRPDGTSSSVDSRTVSVSAQQNATVNFALSAGGILMGRVRDGNDQPVVRAFVQANSVTYVDGIPRLDGAGMGVTDDRGEYRMFWLPPGDYFVYASVQPPGNPNAARRMPPTASVTTSDTPARTFLPGTIDLSRAVSVVVRAGSTVSAPDFALQSATPHGVIGTITSTVPPAANSPTVQAVLQLAPRNTGLSEPIRQAGISILDPGKGQFTIAGVLPGSYEIYARVPSALGGNAWGHASLEVTDKDVSGINIDIAPTVSIPGTIKVNGASSAGTDLQLELIAEGVFAKLVDLNNRMGAQRTFRPAPDGTFNLTNVPPAHYRVDVKGLLPTQYVSDIRQGAASVFDAGFDVTKEAPNPLQIILNEGAGASAGIVHDSAGKPAGGVTIVLVPSVEKRLNWTLYRKTTSNDAGQFSLRSIAPGEYKLFAWDSVPNGAWFDPKFVEKFEVRGTTVRVAGFGSANADLTVLAASGR